ncbi:MAG: Gfo/Idh/MocA family oxidoreductase [Firmicutes bacterium]|jgi:predicted dehydrogenase|nr:Gfo/Idh/MocA family oxidoreductase [Bacillota bacterium]
MNVGIIGCGTVSQYGHIPTLANMPGVELVALSDINTERLHELQRKYEVPYAFADYRDLLALKGLDAVTVATPLHTHADIVCDAARAGLHVLCEKPLAHTNEDGERMIKAMRDANRFLGINFNLRFSDVEGQAYAWKEHIGHVKVVREVFVWHAHQWQNKERMAQFFANGGPVVDSAVHFFDLCEWLTGEEITDVQAVGSFYPEVGAPTHVITNLSLSGGTIGLVEVGWTYTYNTKDRAHHRRFDLIGEHGVISYDNESGRTRLYTAEETITLPARSDKDFPAVYEAFFRAIQGEDKGPLATGEDAYRATRVAFSVLDQLGANPYR